MQRHFEKANLLSDDSQSFWDYLSEFQDYSPASARILKNEFKKNQEKLKII